MNDFTKEELDVLIESVVIRDAVKSLTFPYDNTISQELKDKLQKMMIITECNHKWEYSSMGGHFDPRYCTKCYVEETKVNND